MPDSTYMFQIPMPMMAVFSVKAPSLTEARESIEKVLADYLDGRFVLNSDGPLPKGVIGIDQYPNDPFSESWPHYESGDPQWIDPEDAADLADRFINDFSPSYLEDSVMVYADGDIIRGVVSKLSNGSYLGQAYEADESYATGEVDTADVAAELIEYFFV